MPPQGSGEGSVVAALGPTNTGKTHRAIEQMLDHDSGMIGLPLRLLAREVYDRVSARIGEGQVALVTGEERRVPTRPAYWVCTVEAMPLQRQVDFLAVDEIQLCAHRERGHVFTDRLLHARGRRETWFLGAETMRPILRALVPEVSELRFQRFSRLVHAGTRSLKGLPPRTAVVGFSTEQVYELAERLRRLRGGVAVVLGALSPRTRNAQVAMYQAGEVQYLVATDAIGMGLNLDVDHVAFAALRKFDGREHRDLASDELAQIAGRAGRHLNDGSFGTLRPVPELPPRVAAAIEQHRFPPARQLFWRNADLDFSSIDALLSSLRRPSPDPLLRRVDRVDDVEALENLVRVDEVRELTRAPEHVELLWEVCRIPDFRKLLLQRHASILLEIYRQLRRGDGRLDDDWLARQVRHVDDLRGDIDGLTSRLAAVRTWTYVSHRGGWLRNAADWQARTRTIEDALGDALHERLVERFVERGASGRRRHGAKVTADSGAAQGPFAALRSLALSMSPEAEPETEERFVQRVAEAPHELFVADRAGRLWFEDERIARLVPGNDLRTPGVALEEPEAWTAGARARVERRLVAWARDLVTEASGGFRAGGQELPEARGLAYRLEQGLGVVPRGEALAQWASLEPASRLRFEERGVREGRRLLYVADAISLAAIERRALLASVWQQAPPPRDVPGAAWVPAAVFRDASEAGLFGYEILRGVALRFDLVERVADELARNPESEHPPAVLDALDLPASERGRLLGALGYREGPDGAIRRASKRSRRRRGRRTPPSG